MEILWMSKPVLSISPKYASRRKLAKSFLTFFQFENNREKKQKNPNEKNCENCEKQPN